MSLKCLFGHNWRGYICDRCGSTRDGKTKLDEITVPENLHAGDTFRLFSTSLPYTMQVGWLGGQYEVISMDFDKKKVHYKDNETGKLTDRSFGSTFNGEWSMYCYKVSELSKSIQDNKTPNNLSTLDLIDYIVQHRDDMDAQEYFMKLTSRLQDEFYSNPKAVEKAIHTFGDAGMVNRYNMIKNTMKPSDLEILLPNLGRQYFARNR